MKPAAQAILNYYSECASDQPHPQYMEGLKAAMNIVEALPLESESLALLRELNDALAIPGWLQPRVDAVLDGGVAEPSTREECARRIDELHAEIRRVAWIAEGRPRQLPQ